MTFDAFRRAFIAAMVKAYGATHDADGDSIADYANMASARYYGAKMFWKNGTIDPAECVEFDFKYEWEWLE